MVVPFAGAERELVALPDRFASRLRLWPGDSITVADNRPAHPEVVPAPRGSNTLRKLLLQRARAAVAIVRPIEPLSKLSFVLGRLFPNTDRSSANGRCGLHR